MLAGVLLELSTEPPSVARIVPHQLSLYRCLEALGITMKAHPLRYHLRVLGVRLVLNDSVLPRHPPIQNLIKCYMGVLPMGGHAAASCRRLPPSAARNAFYGFLLKPLLKRRRRQQLQAQKQA